MSVRDGNRSNGGTERRAAVSASIKSLRGDLSISELASATGLDPIYLSQLEVGGLELTLEAAYLIEQALEAPLGLLAASGGFLGDEVLSIVSSTPSWVENLIASTSCYSTPEELVEAVAELATNRVPFEASSVDVGGDDGDVSWVIRVLGEASR